MSAVAACAAAAAGAGYAIIVTISDQTVNAVGASAASAGVKITSGGQYQTGDSSTGLSPSYSDVGGAEWSDRESPTVGNVFEVMLETGVGTVSNGTVDTWLALSSDRSWDVGQNGAGAKSFSGTLKIRRGATVLDTAAITLTATVGF